LRINTTAKHNISLRMVTTADGAGGTDEGPDSKKTTEGDQGFFAEAAREFLQPVFGVEIPICEY
jgi:hypothetical protein